MLGILPTADGLTILSAAHIEHETESLDLDGWARVRGLRASRARSCAESGARDGGGAGWRGSRIRRRVGAAKVARDGAPAMMKALQSFSGFARVTSPESA